jgi:cyclopropane fatty-acyl-phospholipid synthase-like methyltransferase
VTTGSNKSSWEHANRRSNQRKGDFAKSIRAGAAVVPHEVTAKLSLAKGTRVLHLMCNDGREAAYLSQSFGARVTGVDFSREAIRFAQELNSKLGLKNTFIEASAIQWLGRCRPASFDVVITTLGTLWWVANLKTFFRRVVRVLPKRGIYCIWDFHPIVTCVDQSQRLYRPYPFHRMRLSHASGILDYTSDARSFTLLTRKPSRFQMQYSNPAAVTDYRWSMAMIVTAAMHEGFTLRSFEEFDFVWMEKYFPWLTTHDGKRFSAGRRAQPIPLAMRLIFERG